MKLVRCLAILLLGVMAFACSPGADGNEDAESDAGQSPDDDDDNDDDDNDNDDNDSAADAQIELPPYPFWPNDAFVVDEAQLTDLATAYCAAHPGDADARSFFMGEMPLSAFDLVYAPPADAVDSRVLMGDLYLSGYFGGLWLRDLLAFARRSATAEDFSRLKPIFELLAAYTAAQEELSAGGTAAAILNQARLHVPLLIFIYGYNLGYLEQIIAHPPAGVPSPTDVLVCGGDVWLDCDSPGLEWPFLSRYDAAIDKLLDPPDDRWEEMAKIDGRAAFFAAQGRLVWNIIDISQLAADDYLLLVDLSLNFLLASKAAALGHMTAWADELPAEGRDSLLVDAGMIVWAGSYFMGLASPAPAGTFPVLQCPVK